ncbi:MAG: S9 family peptidase, partial [Pseudomonadota bacterium]
MTETKAYGTWPSPITPERLTEAQVGLGPVTIDDGQIYWLESRPNEGGRTVVVRLRADGRPEDDLTPMPFNVRTRVHEYGGGAFAARGGILLATNFSDQRLYRLEPGRSPVALTPECRAMLRFADHAIDTARGIAFAVREDHRGDGEAVNTIVRLDVEGPENEGVIVASGHDFFAAPRLSPDGKQLAFISWDHPNMPWDSTTLWLADVGEAGWLSNVRPIAGGDGVSVMQPCFSPGGSLYYVSDQTGWWNVYRLDPNQRDADAIHPLAAEFAVPAWSFGQSTYGFLRDEHMIAAYVQNGRWHLSLIDEASGQSTVIDLPYTSMSSLSIEDGDVVMRVGAPDRPAAIIALDPESGRHRVLKTSGTLSISPELISVPEPIAFPLEKR